MYRSDLDTKDKGGALVAVIAVHGALLFALLQLSGRVDLTDPQSVLRTFDVTEVPPPPPPVPSTAMFSRTDGVASWWCCVDEARPDAENIEVPGSHIGLLHNPLVLYVIADRLAQPEGEWQPFERTGLKRMLFPDRGAVG